MTDPVQTRRDNHAGRRPWPVGARSRRGFTLVEVLIALAILVMGMVGVMAAFAAAIDLHRRGVGQTSAALLAETILELTQTQALDGESAADISTPSDGKGGHLFVRSQNYPAYECRITCAELNDREYELDVEVRMHPIHEEQDTENVHFRTILLRRPPP